MNEDGTNMANDEMTLEEMIAAKQSQLGGAKKVSTKDFKNLQKKVESLETKVKSSDSGAGNGADEAELEDLVVTKKAKKAKFKKPKNDVEKQILAIIEGSEIRSIPVTLTDVIGCKLNAAAKVRAAAILIKEYRKAYTTKKVKIKEEMDLSLLSSEEKLAVVTRNVGSINADILLAREDNKKAGFKLIDLDQELPYRAATNFELLAVAYSEESGSLRV